MPRPVLQYSKLPFNEQSICRSPFSLVCSPPDDSRKGCPCGSDIPVLPAAGPVVIPVMVPRRKACRRHPWARSPLQPRVRIGHPRPGSPVGKKSPAKVGLRSPAAFPKLFHSGGRVRKDPRAGLRYAPAPKAAADLSITGAAFVHGFSTVPALSSGYGRSGTGFPDCSGRRRPPSLPCGP